MIFKRGIQTIYKNYLKQDPMDFGSKNVLDIIPSDKKSYKKDIINLFYQVLIDKDKKLLQFCIRASFRDGIDTDYIEIFDKLILEKWHDEHEDIVDIVYQFKDDRFTTSLEQIANKPEIYRTFDDEMESTLRKCFHALKAIDSENSRKVIKNLIESKNPNIEAILDMYE